MAGVCTFLNLRLGNIWTVFTSNKSLLNWYDYTISEIYKLKSNYPYHHTNKMAVRERNFYIRQLLIFLIDSKYKWQNFLIIQGWHNRVRLKSKKKFKIERPNISLRKSRKFFSKNIDLTFEFDMIFSTHKNCKYFSFFLLIVTRTFGRNITRNYYCIYWASFTIPCK